MSTIESGSELYYDPFDFEIDTDPYPIWQRLRDEQPALLQRAVRLLRAQPLRRRRAGLVDWEHLQLGQGHPPRADQGGHGDPAGLDHLRGPARATTCTAACCRGSSRRRRWTPSSRRSASSAPAASTRSSAPAGSTSSRDLGAQMPMRTIGMLLGIPEEDQEAHPRPHRRGAARSRRARCPTSTAYDPSDQAEVFAEYIDWRAEHPSDDLMTELLQAEFEDDDGDHAPAHPRGGARLRQPPRRGRQRDHDPAHRLDRQGAGRAPRPAPGAGRGPHARPERHRGAPALRGAVAGARPAT